MQKLLRLTIAALTALVLSISAAFADHMTGSYAGTGDAVGTNLELVQSGVNLTGTLTGVTGGSLQGRTDGGDNVSGILDLNGVGRFQFEATYGDEGFTITLYGSGTSETHLFTRAGGTQIAPANDKYYYLKDGDQVGPVTQADILAAIAAGDITHDTMVWVPGQPEWQKADAYPELAAELPPAVPADKQYYVAENGEQVGPLTLDEVLAKIADGSVTDADLAWTKGMDAWAALSTFTELADAFITPPAIPEEEEDVPPALPEDETPPAIPAEDDETPPAMPSDEEPNAEEEEAEAPEADLDVSSVTTDEGLAAFWAAALEYSTRAQELSEEQRAELVVCMTEVSAKLPGEERIEMVTLLGSGGNATIAEKWPDLPGQTEDCYAAVVAE